MCLTFSRSKSFISSSFIPHRDFKISPSSYNHIHRTAHRVSQMKIRKYVSNLEWNFSKTDSWGQAWRTWNKKMSFLALSLRIWPRFHWGRKLWEGKDIHCQRLEFTCDCINGNLIGNTKVLSRLHKSPQLQFILS